MRYILYVRPVVDLVSLKATVREIDPGAEENVMSMAEKLMSQGEARGRAEMLLKLLPLRFGVVPAEAARRIRTADAATLDRWADRVTAATSIDEVLAG